KKRYNEILFMIDTCQANTMYSKFYSPNILATGSSELDEKSYSFENDNDLGIAVIDSFTHYVLQFMENINKTSQFNSYSFDLFASTAGVRSDLFNRPLDKTYITDFFGGVSQAEVLLPSSSSPSETSAPPQVEDARASVPVSPSQRVHANNNSTPPSLQDVPEVYLFPAAATHVKMSKDVESTLRFRAKVGARA
ncbi:hypothetical protein EIP91_011039, partial [Steccherinum ochraceum]